MVGETATLVAATRVDAHDVKLLSWSLPSKELDLQRYCVSTDVHFSWCDS